MDTVYIETSIISYLRQKPAKDVVAAAHQLLTHHWWDHERMKYELVVSQYVIDESAVGDPKLAADRLGVLPGRSRWHINLRRWVIADVIRPVRGLFDELPFPYRWVKWSHREGTDEHRPNNFRT